jgi:predicted amidophosphoribosyltransferase
MICEKCGSETETVKCTKCGENILKLGPYCYLCGKELHAEAEAEADNPDFDNRTLCSDGTCIGVINEQGICKVCGKPYTPET